MSNDLREIVTDLADRVDRLEAENREQQERIEELESELEEEREKRKDAEQKADAAVAHIQQLWNRIEQVHTDLYTNISGLHTRIDKSLSDPEEGETVDTEPEDPPIYDLVRTPEHIASEVLEPTQRRTRFFWKDLSDYSRSASGGRLVTAGEMRRVLQAHESDYSDTRIESKIVKRVMDLSKTLTRDVVKLKKKDGEWRMFVPKDWKERSREVFRERHGGADSAVS
ncbi:MAG: hypothetical protein IH933_00850 [Euryarchaeota archaeon]|nr:hypothetical protein [Euryarchaeota archaeon]